MGRCDPSTVRMISSFSEAGYLIHSTIVLGPMADKVSLSPTSCHAFFEQTVLKREVGDTFFQGQRV